VSTRILNALIAIWLFVTAFMWPHAHLAQVVTIVAAVLTFVLSILEMYVRGARYLNAVVAVFLFLSALTLPALTRATVWNNAIVAIAILVVALIDRGPQGIRRDREVFGRT
jgi:hypothetical protein